jgi:asparagine N-glycosylation enzyme membrane subunit Stt3
MKDSKATNSTIDKLTLYQTCMAYEQSIRTSYQALLTTLVIAIFGLVLVLVELKRTEHLWMLVVGTMLFCLVFTPACEFRANNVDFWRRKIIELADETELL